MFIAKPSKKKGHFYQHAGHGQKGWKDSGYQADYDRDQLSDEEYAGVLGLHDPVWRYIISHYNKEIYDYQNITPVTILGYRSLPIGIELSQWGYPVTFLCQSQAEQEKAKKDCEIQAGFLRDNIWFNFYDNCPKGGVVCFVGVLDAMKSPTRLFTYINLLLRRNHEIVCAVRSNKNWREILRGKYNYKLIKYPGKPFVMLSIKPLRV